MSPSMRPSTRKVPSQQFPISVNLEFTLRSNGQKIIGRGKTLTLSGKQFTFVPEESLPPEGMITFSMAWPVKLNGLVGLTLCGRGRLIGARLDHATVEFTRYEFRTRPASMWRDSKLDAAADAAAAKHLSMDRFVRSFSS